MFIDKSHIERIKQIPITDYLQSIGINPIATSGIQIVYSSPLVNEKTPSFFVEPKKNVFNDFASGQKGDIVRLVRLIEQIPFFDALSLLESLKSGKCDVNDMYNARVNDVYSMCIGRESDVPPSFSFSGQNSLPTTYQLTITKVHTLSNPALIQYVTQRGISIELSNRYLKEVHFINKGKSYFAIGFQNNSGGYELRNPLDYKGKTANGITVFEKHTHTVNLFEGFFDFLSALQYYNTYSFRYTTIILNTTNNLSLIYPYLLDKLGINCFLDNDKSGKSTVNQLLTKHYPVINQSEILYPNCKDFNDYLLGKSMKTI